MLESPTFWQKLEFGKQASSSFSEDVYSEDNNSITSSSRNHDTSPLEITSSTANASTDPEYDIYHENTTIAAAAAAATTTVTMNKSENNKSEPKRFKDISNSKEGPTINGQKDETGSLAVLPDSSIMIAVLDDRDQKKNRRSSCIVPPRYHKMINKVINNEYNDGSTATILYNNNNNNLKRRSLSDAFSSTSFTTTKLPAMPPPSVAVTKKHSFHEHHITSKIPSLTVKKAKSNQTLKSTISATTASTAARSDGSSILRKKPSFEYNKDQLKGSIQPSSLIPLIPSNHIMNSNKKAKAGKNPFSGRPSPPPLNAFPNDNSNNTNEKKQNSDHRQPLNATHKINNSSYRRKSSCNNLRDVKRKKSNQQCHVPTPAITTVTTSMEETEADSDQTLSDGSSIKMPSSSDANRLIEKLQEELEKERSNTQALLKQKEAIAKDLDYFFNLADQITEERDTLLRKYKSEKLRNAKLLRLFKSNGGSVETDNRTQMLSGAIDEQCEHYSYDGEEGLSKDEEIAALKEDLKCAQRQIEILRNTMEQILKADESANKLLFDTAMADTSSCHSKSGFQHEDTGKAISMNAISLGPLQDSATTQTPSFDYHCGLTHGGSTTAEEEDDNMSITSRDSYSSTKSYRLKMQYELLNDDSQTTAAFNALRKSVTFPRRTVVSKRKDQLEEILCKVDLQLNRVKQKNEILCLTNR